MTSYKRKQWKIHIKFSKIIFNTNVYAQKYRQDLKSFHEIRKKFEFTYGFILGKN